ncbi:2-keto-4-pentenoate hydratase [Brevibacillus sp. TJ4]|uniref:2-keto-4-pentenoate hydratase n=1 Tax=Brevibacillus sp. TJ4 TaxID=3234853 RepID=UPI0037D0D9AC
MTDYLSVNRCEELAQLLRTAEKEKAGIAPLTAMEPGMSVRDAYQIQLINIRDKVEGGQKITGKKIGLTSLAMQHLLGVDQPDYGFLLESMECRNHGEISMQKLMQPKIEAEIAFVLKRDLAGSSVTALDVLLATDYIVPAFEIVDSRIQDWKIKLEDTVADNASSGMYLLGENRLRVEEVDMANLGVALYKNGELVNTGVGSAALGHPANCVAWLANKLSEYGISLKAGEVILSGALSAAVAVSAGDHCVARFAHLGEVGVRFTE